MNKTLNLSMITLLLIHTSISNVYGNDAYTFKLQFGTLSSHIPAAVAGAYWQLQCAKTAEGTSDGSDLTIWRSTADGVNSFTGKPTIDLFDIPADLPSDPGAVYTPWTIIPSGAYYKCDLYLYQTATVGTIDILWGWAPLKFNELAAIDYKTKQYMAFVDPNDPMETILFDVVFWAEAKLYDGPWNIKLSTHTLKNLMDRDFTGLYFKLKCYTKQDSLAEGDSTKYISYEDGYALIQEGKDMPTEKVTCEKFNVKAMGTGPDAFTGWNIAPDLLFYGCDLYLATASSLSTSGETKWAVHPLPLRISDTFTTSQSMKLFQVEDIENERFELEFQLLAEIPQ